MRTLYLLQGKYCPVFLGHSGRLIYRFSDRKTNHQGSLLFETS